MSKGKRTNLWAVTPVFNDFEALELLLIHMNDLNLNYDLRVVIVDDGSDSQAPEIKKLEKHICKKTIVSIDLLILSSNQGNQRAVAQGLKFAFKKARNTDMFVVLDSDGEDSPDSIPDLIESIESDSIVVAKRTRQKSNIILAFWHILFKTTFRCLIGKPINFGNFSLLKYDHCRQIVLNRKLDTSYIGTLLLSGIPLKRIPITRAKRYNGKSRTSPDGLFNVGFQILTVFSDKIFIRLLRIVAVCILLLGTGIVTILCLKLFTAKVISGWAGVMIAVFSTSLVQLIVLLAGLIMIQLNTKSEIQQNDNKVSTRSINMGENRVE